MRAGKEVAMMRFTWSVFGSFLDDALTSSNRVACIRWHVLSSPKRFFCYAIIQHRQLPPDENSFTDLFRGRVRNIVIITSKGLMGSLNDNA